MSNAFQTIRIRHVDGAKINQTDEFDANRVELTIGRDTGSDIRFDPDQDLSVSRQHGRILLPARPGEPFRLVDNSKNGLFINGLRITDSAPLQPGDMVQVGANGPRFVLDVFPEITQGPPATRLVGMEQATKEVRMNEVPQLVQVDTLPKVGIGRDTFERAIGSERKQSNKRLGAVLLGLLLVVGAGGYAIWQHQKKTADELVGSRDSLNAVLNKEIVGLRGNLTKLEEKAKNQPLADNEVGALVMDKVVQIEMSWSLFDARTGEPLWHLWVPIDTVGTYAPAFIRRQDGNLDAYLFKAKSNLPGLPVTEAGSGTGFMVSKDGLLLTNRHVAAGWDTRYNFPSVGGRFLGVLVEMDQKGQLAKKGFIDQPVSWIPSETQLVDGQPGQVSGRNSYMNVVFPGSTNRRAATLVSPSQIHDVALVKVALAQPVEPVATLDNYNTVPKGESVVCIGYPGVSPEIYSVRKSNDNFKRAATPTTVANPTMTSGTITNLIKSSTEFDNKQTMGDYLQLSINATGPGNSGGPLLNRKGEVIGIFTMSRTGSAGELVTFAIPIKYGLELLTKN
ncbi:trypsin-like peptidase domain-containing protein [Fibrella aquatilis]|uniref:Trypsin-like peptidase domain-containing protein n=1 Tax=Fibrella aquatilis TaxID=2817059 RepID=A0A939G2U0_9BACT|nr:trypsin-like peptidase domain-containing protein [Fibrella aquatilis]MBO0929415.1 trypsin-like peptidase domain-containing protein [Fibrella aquatilis]